METEKCITDCAAKGFFFGTFTAISYMMTIMTNLAPRTSNSHQLDWLEPSAGMGNIVDSILALGVPIDRITMIEKDEAKHRFLLNRNYFDAIHDDFLTFTAEPSYDRILMVPPFATDKDETAFATHILHAYEFLNDDGVLVAVAPISVIQSQNNSQIRELFRLMTGKCGFWQVLPDTAFFNSGLDHKIKTVVLGIKG